MFYSLQSPSPVADEVLSCWQMEKNKAFEDVIPIVAEEIEIGKRQVATGGVRVHKTVTERQQTVDEPLLMENAEVTRVAVNRVIESTPSVRYEGTTMIIPIVEEQLIFEKRLVLKEEIHVRKVQGTVHQPQSITLREEHAHIERFGENAEQLTGHISEQDRIPLGDSVLDRVFPPGSKSK